MKRTREKLLGIGLIITSLIGYLEWGKDNHTFLAQAEVELFQKAISDPMAVLHPFTIVPLAGQILILISLFQRVPARKLTLIGLGCLSTIMLFLFFIGISAPNVRILLSAIPFMVFAALTIRYYRRASNQARQ